jgi:uncharacterized protein
MILDDEEVFFVDYEDDKTKKMVYVPLRSYLALVPATSVTQLLGQTTSPSARAFIARLKQRPLISVKQTLDELHRCTPQLTIALTEDCNLRCQYCYAAAGDPRHKASMSKRLISKVVAKYFNTQHFRENEPVEITFMGGGEPTFRFDLLKHAVSDCRRCAKAVGVSCTFSIATNGHYGQTIRQFLAANFSNISLSLDGPAFIQDVHRPTPNGSGSFDVVFETAQHLYKAGAAMAFRATVTSHSVHHVRDIVDFFASHFPNTSLGFEVFIPHGRGAYCTAVRPPHSDQFAQALLDALVYGKQKRYAVTNAAASEYHIVRAAFCSAVAVPNWTVTVDGVITCCAREGAPDQFSFGFYDEQQDRIVLDDKKIADLRALNVLNYEACADCFCKYNCAGDCPDRRLEGSYQTDCDSIRQVGAYTLAQKLANTA